MVSRIGALLLGAVLVLPSRAVADNTADEADVAFRLGNSAYARGRYEEALAAYFLSNRLVPNANVVFNIARCYEAMKQFDEAYRYYNDLSAQQLSASDRRDVSEALQRMRPRVALVKVTSQPVAGSVFIDREDLGARGLTPQTLALPPGRHLVRVKAEGYKPAETVVTLARGREAQVALSLQQIVGEVEVSGFPEGAWVKESADGPVIAQVPGRVRLPPGRRLLHVGAEGYLATQVLVEVTAEKTSSITVTLQERPLPMGKVVVVANREDAQVKVDGKQAGFTPTVLSLPEGTHEVEVSYPELRTWSGTVEVEADAESKVVAELRYAPPPVRAASKTLLSLDEAPASTSVLSGEEIRSFGYQNLAEALAAIRGVFITNDRMYQHVGVRGFAPPGDLNTRVLILWDGHPMNDVWAGQGYAGHDLDVDLADVARIEIVRGPGSALYGTGAFFAVINVVPREGLPGGRNVEAVGAVGGLSSWRGRVTGSYGDAERGYATVSVGALGARGAETTNLGPRGLVLGLDSERAQNATAKARWGDFSLNAFINQRFKEVPSAPYGTRVGAPGTTVLDLRGFAELRFDHDFSSSSVSARAYLDRSYYDGHKMYAAEVAGEPDELNTEGGAATWVGGELRYRFRLFAENQLTAGVETQVHLSVDQEILGPAGKETLDTVRRSILSAYLLDEWRVAPRLSISAGLRVDKYSDLGEVPITPRVAVIARPYQRGLTKLVAGQAFRAPNAYELYYHDGNVSQRVAEALDPETITTFEAEHSHDLTEELRLTVAGYHNRVSNLIELRPEPGEPGCILNGAPAVCDVNVNVPGLLAAWGAEAELRWQPGPLTFLDLAYSFVTLQGENQAQATAPAHLFSARLMVPFDAAVRMTAQATYTGTRELPSASGRIPDQLLLNAGVAGELGALRYFAGVTNLLDSSPLPVVGADAPWDAVPSYGRGFLLQVSGTY